MEKIKKILPFAFLLLILAVVYRVWFGLGLLTGGDFGVWYKSMYGNDYFYPYAWYWNQGMGIGGNAVALLWIYFDFAFTKNIFSQILGFPWSLTERIAYFFPFLILSVTSSIVLARKLFPKNPFFIVSSFIFLVNSYILMIVAGGQLWIFLSYAMTPLVLYMFMKGINQIMDEKKHDLSVSFVIGLIFSVLFVIDLRIAYISFSASFLYLLLKVCERRNIRKSLEALGMIFVIPGITTLLIHAFWILPTIVVGQNPLHQLGVAFSSTQAVKYFSFATFENTIGLLHPNWPENIFGKVGFMKPEFLIYPILAFSSLLFIGKSKEIKDKTTILFFIVLALIGIFLAKGSNDPFGLIYIWLFLHIPGFVMFRDPTKWYVLIAISYSILIPFTIWRMYEWITLHNKIQFFKLQNIFLLVVVCLLLFPLRPALTGQLNGTLKSTQVPNEYIRLEQFLSSQQMFFRTLWFPTIQRFGLNSSYHPAIPGQAFLQTSDLTSGVKKLGQSEEILQYADVKYIIIPEDTNGEIFVKDRKYDDKLYIKTIDEVKQIPFIKQINGFGKIDVFEVPRPKDHFWSTKGGLIKNYTMIHPTEYEISIQNAKKGDVVVFADSYDVGWIATTGKNSRDALSSTKFDGVLNSFVLQKKGNYMLHIDYSPQKWVDIGVVLSIVSIFGISAYLLGFLLHR